MLKLFILPLIIYTINNIYDFNSCIKFYRFFRSNLESYGLKITKYILHIMEQKTKTIMLNLKLLKNIYLHIKLTYNLINRTC